MLGGNIHPPFINFCLYKPFRQTSNDSVATRVNSGHERRYPLSLDSIERVNPGIREHFWSAAEASQAHQVPKGIVISNPYTIMRLFSVISPELTRVECLAERPKQSQFHVRRCPVELPGNHIANDTQCPALTFHICIIYHISMLWWIKVRGFGFS